MRLFALSSGLLINCCNGANCGVPGNDDTFFNLQDKSFAKYGLKSKVKRQMVTLRYADFTSIPNRRPRYAFAWSVWFQFARHFILMQIESLKQ